MPALNKSITVRLMADASNFNAGIRAAGANAQQLADGMEQSGRKTSLLTTGLAAAGMAAGALGVAAIKTASDFDASMSGVQSVTRASAAEMELLRQAAIDAGADTIYSASEAATGITELGKAGLTTADILSGGLNGALDLAASEGIEVGEAAELMATALTQFGLSGDRATDVADALAAGAGNASGSARDLGFALSQTGTMAHTYGISMEETVGALSAFASAGMIGSDAGTSLRSMLQHLGNPTDKAKSLMEELGISVYDAQGHFVGLADLAGQLQTQMGGLSEEERNAAMATIFGADAVRAATQLYNQGAEGVEKWTEMVSQSGYAADMASTRTDNLQGDIEQLSGSFETLLINLGEGGQGPLRSLVKTLDMLVDTFAGLPPEVQQFAVMAVAAVGGFTALHKALTPLNTSASKTAKTFGQLIDPWQRVLNALPQLKSGFGDLGLAAATAMTGVDKLPGTMSRGQLAMKGFSGVAQGVVSLMGGPWGIALGVAGAALMEWAQDAQRANAAADSIKNAFETTGDATEALVTEIENMELGNGNFLPEWMDRIKVAADDVPDLLDKCGLSISDLALAAQGDEEALTKYEDTIKRLSMQFGTGTARSKELANVLDQARSMYENGSESADKHAEAVEEVSNATGGATDATETNTDAIEAGTEAADEYVVALGDLIDNLFQLEEGHISAFDAQTRLNESIQNLTDSFAKNGATIDMNTEQGRENRDALSGVASQALETAQAILEEGNQMDLSGESTDGLSKATENARGVLNQARQAFISHATAAGMDQAAAERLATQMGLTGNKVDELALAIKNVPGYKGSTVEVHGVNDAIWQVRQLSAAISLVQSKDVTIRVNRVTQETTIHSTQGTKVGVMMGEADGGLIGGYAEGGLMRLANGDGYAGLIHGWGGKKADVMPIMASRGEFMQQASAVDYYGVDAMKALNERKIPREWLRGPQQGDFVSNRVSNNVTINVQGAGDPNVAAQQVMAALRFKGVA